MTAIATNNSSAYGALASLLREATSSPKSADSAAGLLTVTGSSGAPSKDPADTVDLSDRAKATLLRAKSERIAAGKLAAQVQTAQSAGGKDKTIKSTTDSESSVLGALLSGSAQQQQAGETTWEAGAPYGDASISDADFTEQLKGSLSFWADDYDRRGLPPEAGQALRNAFANGTLKFQKASEVQDLNFQSAHTFTRSAIGGGYDSFGGTSQTPTGATKDAIDQGRAIAMWTADRGDIYITW